MTARAAIRQADVTRALRGAAKAGVAVRLVIDPRTGTIDVYPVDAVPTDREAQDLDRRMREAFEV